MWLRRIVKTRGQFPTDEAATKLLYLALVNVQANGDEVATPGRLPCPCSRFSSASASVAPV